MLFDLQDPPDHDPGELEIEDVVTLHLVAEGGKDFLELRWVVGGQLHELAQPAQGHLHVNCLRTRRSFS